jgi:hypothetical protein
VLQLNITLRRQTTRPDENVGFTGYNEVVEMGNNCRIDRALNETMPPNIPVSTSPWSARNHQVNKPAFFIVGAPRCGTTALSQYLRQHPGIYLSYVKEPHYFGSDLDLRRGFRTEKEYLELFEAAQNQLCGEASTWYLYSKLAAQEIYTFNPDAKIIIMLRNPADMIYSWYGHVLLRGEETIENFEEALQAEEDRRQGKRIPKNTPNHKLLYTDIPRYTEQIQRYYDVFDSSNINIILYDDFQADQRSVVKNVFTFLGVDSSFKPDVKIVNAHGRVKSKVIRNLINNQPEVVRKIVKTLVPRKFRHQLRHSIRLRNIEVCERVPLAPELREHLNSEFADEIARLSSLLNYDLSHWTTSQQ